MSIIDDLSPRYYGESRIRLSLRASARQTSLLVFRGIVLDVDYSRALPEGVVLPLVFSVTAPSPGNSFTSTYRRLLPRELAFTPREGGSHLIRLAERDHNRWFGALVVDIDMEGDRVRIA